uniref:Uncharacterized protein n=1 Tax=viral metagenome TaxID=1070528 RepID=A0A6M3IVE1_9ZZZZ
MRVGAGGGVDHFPIIHFFPSLRTKKQKGVMVMPKGYEKMRDEFKRQGLSDKAAKEKAARIWNSKHKGSPVTRRGK